MERGERKEKMKKREIVDSRSSPSPRPLLFNLDLFFLFHFLQPGKSLYTSMRELVENSLDAAESINELPDIEISM